MFLKHYLKYGKKIHSLEFDGTLEKHNINWVSAEVSRNEIKKIDKKNFNSINQAKEKIKKQPCFLNINGPQVLLKMAAKNPNYQDAISLTFPNLDLENVYYQIWEFDNSLLIAISRKNFIDDIIAEFSKNSIHVIGFSLSFFSVQNILSWIELQMIFLDNYIIDQTASESIQIRKYNNETSPETYKIQDETIKSSFIIAFSGLFNYFSSQSLANSNLQKKNKELYKKYIDQIFFIKFLTVSLGFLCLVLLINYFMFSTYYNQYQDLAGRKILMQENNKKYQSLKNSKEEKLELIEYIKLNSHSKVLYRLNKLVTERPNEISFTEIIFQPINSNIVANEPIDLINNKIVIQGITKKDTIFTEWLINLEKISWIEKIEVSDFVNNEHQSAFSMVISTTNETKK